MMPASNLLGGDRGAQLRRRRRLDRLEHVRAVDRGDDRAAVGRARRDPHRDRLGRAGLVVLRVEDHAEQRDERDRQDQQADQRARIAAQELHLLLDRRTQHHPSLRPCPVRARKTLSRSVRRAPRWRTRAPAPSIAATTGPHPSRGSNRSTSPSRGAAERGHRRRRRVERAAASPSSSTSTPPPPCAAGQLGQRALGDDRAGVHDRDPVAQLLDLLHVVAGVEDGHAVVAQRPDRRRRCGGGSGDRRRRWARRGPAGSACGPARRPG